MAAHGSEAGHPTVGHVVPLWLLAAVFGALLVLTWVTVAATYVDMGGTGNLAIALLIALVKASLVALYFMHLRWDRPINAIVLIGALLFVALFCGFALLDSATYRPQVEQYRQDNPLRLSNPYAPAMDEPVGR